MSGILVTLFEIISMALGIFQWIVIAMIIMSWLINFNVINLYNQVVATIWDVLVRLTEPVLAPIRRIVPPVGGLDLSPIILFFAIYFLQGVIGRTIIPAVIGL